MIVIPIAVFAIFCYCAVMYLLSLISDLRLSAIALWPLVLIVALILLTLEFIAISLGHTGELFERISERILRWISV